VTLDLVFAVALAAFAGGVFVGVLATTLILRAPDRPARFRDVDQLAKRRR
jgi:hypothetical protein